MEKPERRNFRKMYETLLVKYNDLVRRYNAISGYAPEVRKCRECTGYYVSGYICSCGCDNSVEDE